MEPHGLRVPTDYTLEAPLGEGGMGVVYLARHTPTGRRVALKTLTASQAGALGGLRREVAALRHLDHPGVVRIVDDGVCEGVPWVAMELLTGLTVGQHLRLADDGTEVSGGSDKLPGMPDATLMEAAAWRPGEGGAWARRLHTLSAEAVGELGAVGGGGGERTMEVSRLEVRGRSKGAAFGEEVMEWLGWIGQVCQTLGVVHGQGIVHGDLKPDNLLVTDQGRVVLLDFGLATRFGGRVEADNLEVAGLVQGTMRYISPEAIRGERLDARSDLYAVGVLLYRVLTGALPFEGSVTSLLVQHLNAAPTPPRERGIHVPAALEALVLALLAKAPADRPGHAWAVLDVLEQVGVTPVPRSAGAPYLFESPLFGRGADLDRLGGLWPVGDRAAAVMVTGPVGIGKTRLAVELIRRARGRQMRVVATWASALDADGHAVHSPLQLFAPVFRRWIDDLGAERAWKALGADGPVLARFVPELATYEPTPALSLSSVFSPQQLYAAVASVLDALARSKPLCLVADDLQNADALSLLALQHLLELPRPWLVIGVLRTGHPSEGLRALTDRPNTTTLSLAPLDIDSVGCMANAILGTRTLPADIVDHLYTRSEGNPYFLAELLRLAVDRGVWSRDLAGRWQLAADGASLERVGRPASIEELVRRRLDGLAPPVRRVCDAAAVAGREFAPGLIGEALHLGQAPVLWALDRLVAEAVLEPGMDGNLRFSHQHVRDVATDALAPEVRRDLHRMLADALDAAMGRGERVEAARVAWHRRSSGEHERAAVLYMQAGRDAAPRFAFTDAEAHFAAALELLPPHSPRRIDVHLELAEHVLLAQGRYEEGRRRLAELDLRDATALQRGTTLGLIGEFLNHLGHFDRALETLTAGLDTLPADQAARRARMLKVFADALYRKGLFPRSLELYEQARALATDDVRLSANIDQNEALVHQAQGRYERALGLYERALGAYQAVGDRRGEGMVLTNFANLCTRRGRLAQGLSLHHAALKIHREMRNRTLESLSLNNLSLVERKLGNLARALELLEESLALRKELGDFRRIAYVLGNIGDLYGVLGRTAEAVEQLQVATSATRRLGERKRTLVHLNHLARCWLDAGYIDRALPFHTEAVELAAELGERMSEAEAMLNEAHIAELRGDAVRALHHLQRALSHYRDIRHEGDAILCLVLLARNHLNVGHLGFAQRMLDDAWTEAEGQANRPAMALVQLQRAALERRHGRIDAARRQLEQAWRYFDRAGIEPARLECMLEQVELAVAVGQSPEAWLSLAGQLAGTLDLGPDSRLRRALEALQKQRAEPPA